MEIGQKRTALICSSRGESSRSGERIGSWLRLIDVVGVALDRDASGGFSFYNKIGSVVVKG